jgi:hypothetical protein
MSSHFSSDPCRRIADPGNMIHSLWFNSHFGEPMFLDHCEKEEIHSQDTLLGEVQTVHTSVVHDVFSEPRTIFT